jgi:hypothetical protein
MILNLGGWVWIGLIWLRKGTNGGLLQTLNVLRNVRVPRKTVKFLARGAILASQEICPTDFARTCTGCIF